MRSFLRKLGQALVRDAIDDVGAMMAYYAILAVFPMLLFVVTLAALVLPESMIVEGARLALEGAPTATQSLVESQIDTLTEHARAGFAFGTVVLAVWGASRGASGLMFALNRLFRRVETRSWLRRQAITLAVTVGVAALLMIALGLLVVGPLIGGVAANRLGLGSVFEIGWTVGRWIAAALLVMVVWALVFRFLPDTNAPLRIFTPGALVSVVLWLLISRLFGLYLDRFASFSSIYGALASAVILLSWLWLSSMVANAKGRHSPQGLNRFTTGNASDMSNLTMGARECSLASCASRFSARCDDPHIARWSLADRLRKCW